MKKATGFLHLKMMVWSIFMLLLTLASSETIMAQPGVTIFEDDFEGGFKPEWTPTPNATGSGGVVDVVSNGGINNSMGARMGKTSGEGNFTENHLDLKVALLNQTHVKLSFWVFRNNDETQAQDGIWLSTNNGATFTQIWQFNVGDWCDSQWGQYPPFELSKLAAAKGLTLNNQTIIRFVQRDNEDFSSGGTGRDGLFFDDVRVYSQPPNYFQLTSNNAFFDDFEDVLSNHWAWRFADSTATLSQRPTQPSNVVDIFSGDGLNNSRGLTSGLRHCDGDFLTNAADLHVNFSGLSAAEKSRVELSFWIRAYDEETQADDGIYFSDDGGLTWVKIFIFAPGDWCNTQYGQFPPLQLEAMVNARNKSLTANSIIRFQQHDDEDFSNGGTGSDGISIDDVRVYVAPRSYTKVPFFEDFEAGLREMEVWSFYDDPAMPSPSITSPANVVGVFPDDGVNSSNGLTMGKRFCDGDFRYNAFQILTNLNGASGVQMSYSIYSYNEETQANDGIYFSDNGGVTFKKVANFVNFASNQWNQNTINVDALAASNGLEFTSNFIIRFVQYDDEDFFNGGSGSDGISLDNINITATTPTTSTWQPLLAEHPVKIYPNPSTQDRVYAELPDHFADQNLSWRLYDAQGRLLRSQTVVAATDVLAVDCSGLPEGILFLEIQGDTKVWLGRFVKQ